MISRKAHKAFLVVFSTFLLNSYSIEQVYCQDRTSVAEDGITVVADAPESAELPQSPEQGVQDIEQALAGLLQMLNAQQPQGEENGSSPIMPGANLAQLATPDIQQALAELTRAAIQQVFMEDQRKRKATLSLLAEDVQALINQAHDAYQLITQEITITSVLTSLCVSIRQAVNHLDSNALSVASKKEDIAKLDQQLARLHDALVTGSFESLIQQMVPVSEKMGMNIAAVDPSSLMMQLMQGGMLNRTRSAVAYTLEDVNELHKVLQDPGLISFLGEVDQKSFETLQAAVAALASSNVSQLAHITFSCTHGRCIQVMKQLDEVCALLDKKFTEKAGMSIFDYLKKRQTAQGDDEEERPRVREITEQDALAYWYKELRKFAQTLKVFNQLKDAAQLEKDSGEGLMAFYHHIAHAYDMGLDFFDLYMRDHDRYDLQGNQVFKWHDKRILVPYFVNYALRGALSLWVYNDTQGKMSRGGALQIAMGQSSLASQNHVNFLLSRWSAVMMAGLTFWKPDFGHKAPHALVQGMSKILVAWSYYHLCHVNLFGEERSYWPNNDRFLLESLLFGAQQVTKTVTDEFSWQVRRHANPASLETLEDVSWGVLRPEMISVMLESFIPYAFLYVLPKNFVNARRSDVYGSWYQKGIIDAFLNQHRQNPGNPIFQPMEQGVLQMYQARHQQIMSNTSLSDQQRMQELRRLDALRENRDIHRVYAHMHVEDVIQRYQNFTQVDPDLYYIEQNLINYVASSIGMYWGRHLTKKYKPYVTSFFSKAIDFGVDCLETVGLVSEGTAEQVLIMKDDLADDMDEIVGMLKKFVSQLVEQRSPFRPMVLRFLIEYGYLDAHETDPRMINRSMIIGILSELIRFRLFSNGEAALIIQSFEENPDNMDAVVHLVVDGLKDNVIALMGGMAGSTFLSVLASMACWQWGPFYPKVKQALAK